MTLSGSHFGARATEKTAADEFQISTALHVLA